MEHTQAIADTVTPAVTAVAEYAREILAHERAQATLHFASIGIDAPCQCEDCRNTYRYPVSFYHIARRIVARYGVA